MRFGAVRFTVVRGDGKFTRLRIPSCAASPYGAAASWSSTIPRSSRRRPPSFSSSDRAWRSRPRARAYGPRVEEIDRLEDRVVRRPDHFDSIGLATRFHLLVINPSTVRSSTAIFGSDCNSTGDADFCTFTFTIPQVYVDSMQPDSLTDVEKTVSDAISFTTSIVSNVTMLANTFTKTTNATYQSGYDAGMGISGTIDSLITGVTGMYNNIDAMLIRATQYTNDAQCYVQGLRPGC